MTNAELIAALRWCPSHGCGRCVALDANGRCTAHGVVGVMHSAADALEAAEKRIAELEAQLPKPVEWIVDKNGYPQIICSICDVHIPMVAGWCMDAHIKYCPNCGSRMAKGEQE